MRCYIYLVQVLIPPTPVLSFEESTNNIWAGQRRAAAYSATVGARFGTTGSVISVYVYLGVKKILVYPEILWTNSLLLFIIIIIYI